MGKGGGACCSVPEALGDTVNEQDAPLAEDAKDLSSDILDEPLSTVEEAPAEGVLSVDEEQEYAKYPSTKVFIVYYSMYGHTLQLAKKIKEGVDSVDGAEGFLFQVPEILSESVLEKMMAPPKPEDIPVIQAQSLVEADAIIFGFPTRFGSMCSQMKSFFDSTGTLWQSQALAGKPAGFFFSTGTQGGGQETTALTAVSQLAHHGMLFVPVGYTFQGLFNPDVHGGSPYGAGTFAGDGTRSPVDLELDLAVHQGRLIALVATKLKKGSI